jgi:hypothetical protein
MRIPAVLVVSIAVVVLAWSYGPAWAVFGALAVGMFAFLGLRQRLRGSRGDSASAGVLLAPGYHDGGAAGGGCGDGGGCAGGGDGGGGCA